MNLRRFIHAAAPAALALLVCVGCSRQARVVWQRRFDSVPANFGSSVATDGRDIIVGTTCRDTTAGVPGTAWQFLRYDRNGNLQWHRACVRGEHDSLASVAVAADHDIVGVGCTGLNAATDPVRLSLARFSAQGDVKWQKEYQFASITRGAAVRLDTIGRIWVCGSVTPADSGTSDILVARFDSLGNLLDSTTVDFGADETGQDLLLLPSRFGTMGIFATGLRTSLPGKPDTLKTSDVVVVRLDPDLHEIWRWVYNQGGDDLYGRLSWQNYVVCMAVTSREQSGVATHLVERSSGDYYLPDHQDTRYPGAPNASCAGLVRDRGGALLGVGAYGPDGQQRCLGWRYLHGKFTDFLSGSRYASGANDRAEALSFDADGNVIVTGESDSGANAGILIIKLALPRHRPPPDLWLPNMYR
jgi:hypothetical protein